MIHNGAPGYTETTQSLRSPRDGCYAAHQEPEVLADDLREFYRKLA
jgi:hypothetical protein